MQQYILLIELLVDYLIILLLWNDFMVMHLIVDSFEFLVVHVGQTCAHIMIKSYNFTPNSVFLGYSNMHKGFKCLDISTGRVYISRDVFL